MTVPIEAVAIVTAFSDISLNLVDNSGYGGRDKKSWKFPVVFWAKKSMLEKSNTGCFLLQ